MSTAGSPVEGRKGEVDGSGLRVVVLVARFNEHITGRLLGGAAEALSDHGVASDDVEVIWVPGAWELPQAAQRAVDAGRFDAGVELMDADRVLGTQAVLVGTDLGIVLAEPETSVETQNDHISYLLEVMACVK